ncbi:hypothetical protein HPB50_012770 [Hyalomma asiaticum]|uniref:Uncharacterized protein n=1 Tax=Hyalomma asiaticum TaxID=266040 RepID=A0ACB7RMF3_HYAAI|nr:hypothetical protein HPB50_012770 [Hyalomma asiaticum]
MHHRKYRVTHSASLSFGYVHALVSITRTTIHVVPWAPPHRRPVSRLDQGFTAGLQARTLKRRRGGHEQASLAPTRLQAEKAATADGSCRYPPRGPEVRAEAWMIRRQAAGDVSPAAQLQGALGLTYRRTRQQPASKQHPQRAQELGSREETSSAGALSARYVRAAERSAPTVPDRVGTPGFRTHSLRARLLSTGTKPRSPSMQTTCGSRNDDLSKRESSMPTSSNTLPHPIASLSINHAANASDQNHARRNLDRFKQRLP